MALGANTKLRVQTRQQTLDGLKQLLFSLEAEGAEVYGAHVEHLKDHLKRRIDELERRSAQKPRCASGRRFTGLRLWGRLLGEARPYRRHIASLFVLSLLSSVFVLLTPLPLKIAVDSVVGSHPLPGFIAAFVPAGLRHSQTGVLLVAAGLFVLISLLKQLQQFGSLVLTTYAGVKLLIQFRSRLFHLAQR